MYFFHYHLPPNPSPHNHHTVVLAHESFFFFLCPTTPLPRVVSLLSIRLKIFLVIIFLLISLSIMWLLHINITYFQDYIMPKIMEAKTMNRLTFLLVFVLKCQCQLLLTVSHASFNITGLYSMYLQGCSWSPSFNSSLPTLKTPYLDLKKGEMNSENHV